MNVRRSFVVRYAFGGDFLGRFNGVGVELESGEGNASGVVAVFTLGALGDRLGQPR